MTVSEILAASQFVALRYEGRHVECTGITAVAKQEQKVFHGRGGTIILPWSSRMPSAKAASSVARWLTAVWHLKSPSILYRKSQFVSWLRRRRIWRRSFTLPPMDFLTASNRPMTRPTCSATALFFGVAVKSLLSGKLSPQASVSGTDWQTVPALLLLHSLHLIAITLHNTFDTYLGNNLANFSELHFADFRTRTALQVALETCDVVTTVNRGYAYGLKHEVFHRRIMAEHLQFGVDRIVGIDNANFVDPNADQLALANLLQHDPPAGLAQLNQLQNAAPATLPGDLARRASGKVLHISMGRRSSQKLHDVVVEAVRDGLHHEPSLPLFVFFATTHSDEGSPARLDRIKRLCDEFPENCGWSDGRVPFFSQLMASGSFNVMCSLWAPHEAAFEATIVPIARAVDGLAAQVVPLVRRPRRGIGRPLAPGEAHRQAA